MRFRSAVILAAAALAAGCTSPGTTDDPDPTEDESATASDPVEADRPLYSAEVDQYELCPTGPELEAMASVPENPAVELFHNARETLDDGEEAGEEEELAATGPLSCEYAYMAGDEAVERIDADFATLDAELEVLDQAVEAEPDPSAFPEAPEHFQPTGWEHTATEEETEICLSDAGLVYKECEDGGETLVNEVFTLTGFDSNLQVELQVEYRHGGDEAAAIEDRSRQIAAEFLPVLTERVPTAG